MKNALILTGSILTAFIAGVVCERKGLIKKAETKITEAYQKAIFKEVKVDEANEPADEQEQK